MKFRSKTTELKVQKKTKTTNLIKRKITSKWIEKNGEEMN